MAKQKKKQQTPKPKAKAKKKPLPNMRSVIAGILATSAKLVRFTGAMAKKVLKDCRYERQRPTRSVTIAHLLMFLRQEMFLPATAIYFAVGKGIKETMLDAYHRMEALARWGGSVLFVKILYRVKDMQTVHDLYTLFDNGLGKRQPGDMFSAHAGPEAVESVGRSKVQRLVSAVRFIADMFSQSIAKVQTHYTYIYCVAADHFIKPMGDLLKLLAGETHGLSEQSILQQPILAVALATLRYCPKKAHEFWDSVIHNGVLLTNDSRHVLRMFLLGLQVVSERKPNGQRATVTPRQKAYIAAYCWNQFYKGETLLGIDIGAVDKRAKVTIAGTPFSANSTPARIRQALMDLGFCEEHLEHVEEAVKVSKTHYNTKKPKAKKRKKDDCDEDSVEVNVNVLHTRRSGKKTG